MQKEYYKYFIVILLFIIPIYTQAQNNKSAKKNNLGFVFVDGKYIKPPYRFKRKDLSIYLCNNILYTYEGKERNPYSYNMRLPIPPCLDSTSGFNEIELCKEPLECMTYLDAMTMYYLKNYIYEAAIDSIVNYTRSFPNVKRVEKNTGFDGFWTIEFKNGESRNILFGGMYAKSNSLKWGPGGTGPTTKKEYNKKLKQWIEYYKTHLYEDEEVFMFFSNHKDGKNYIRLGYAKDFIPDYYRILKSSYSEQQLVEEMERLIPFNHKEYIPEVIKYLSISRSFEKRVISLGYDKLVKSKGCR